MCKKWFVRDEKEPIDKHMQLHKELDDKNETWDLVDLLTGRKPTS